MITKYFNLQLKRFFKICPAILLITFVTLLGIAVTCLIVIHNNLNSDSKTKFSLGVVGDVDNTYFEIGLYALQNLDDTRFCFDFIKLDQQQAQKMLKDRQINGYVYIPDDYVDGFYGAKVQPAKFVALNSPDGFGETISTEITKFISEMLRETQNGMYGMQDVSHDYNTDNFYQNIDSLMFKYIESILSRSKLFKTTTLGIADSLSFGGYYLCGIIVIMLMLWGISCNKYFSSRQVSFWRLLNNRKVNGYSQVICEYGAYLVITILTFCIFSIAVACVIGNLDIGIPETVGVTFIDAIAFTVKILPVIMMIAMMQMCIYELVNNTIGSVLFQIIFTFGVGYISGCFYPNYFFPEIVQKTASVLPVGVAFSYIRKALSDMPLTIDFIWVIAYFSLFMCICILTRNYKMRSEAIK